jgi:uncharacterized membrane protein
MANTQIAPERFEIGRVISRTFGVIGRNLLTFLVLSTLLTLPVLLITFAAVWLPQIGVHYTPSFGTPGSVAALVGGAVVGFLIYFLFANLLQAGLTHGTIVSLNGGRVSLGDCLVTGLRHAVPLTIIVILATLGFVLGFLLIIVPGVILALAWAVITPVRVAERTGITQTFRRSAELTRGNRGSIFLIDLIFGVLILVLDFVIRPLAGLSFVTVAGEQVTVVFIVLTSIVRITSSLIGATLAASIYYELRVIKEGIGPEQLAAIFS